MIPCPHPRIERHFIIPSRAERVFALRPTDRSSLVLQDNIFFLGQSYKFLGTPWLPNLFFEWSQTWPETPFIRYIGFANSEILIANNITAYRDMLRAKNRCFAKPDSTRFTVIGVLGDGLPFAEGEMHRRHKTLLIRE